MAIALADADLPLVSMERESGGPLPIIQVSNELRGQAALARSPFVVYVLRRDDVARLLHDPRLRGPGLDILRQLLTRAAGSAVQHRCHLLPVGLVAGRRQLAQAKTGYQGDGGGDSGPIRKALT